MKQNVLVLLTLLCALAATLRLEAQDKERRLIESAVNELNRAMIDADKDDLARLTSERLSYGHSSWLIEDKQAFIAAIIDGTSRFTEINLSDQTISRSGDIAIVRHKFSAATANKGQAPGKVMLGVMQIWHNERGKWVLIARQATRLP